MNKIDRTLNNYFIVFLSVSVATIIFITYFVIISGDFFVYNIWGDRALSRAAALSQQFQVYGSEYGGRQGTRAPGGALYYYIYVISLIENSPIFIYLFAISAHFVSVYLLFLTGRTIYSPIAGGIAAATYAASLAVNDVTWPLWNPLFALPFGVAGYFFFYRWLCGKSRFGFIYAVAALCLAAQMHIAFLALLFALIIVSLVYGKNIRGGDYLAALMVGILLYAPWIVSQLFGGLAGDGLPVKFFPGFTDMSASAGPAGAAVYEFGVLGRAKWLARLFTESLSFAEINHVRIGLPVVSLGLASLLFLLVKPAMPGVEEEISRLRRHGSILLLIVVICIAIVFIVGNLTYAPGVRFEVSRYFMPAAPGAALLAGVAIAGLCKYADLTRHSNLVRLIAVIAVSVIPLKVALIAYDDLKILKSGGYYRPGWMLYTAGSRIPYKDMNELFRQLGRTYEQHLDIKDRVASVVLDGAWKFVLTPSERILELQRPVFKDAEFTGCLLVLWRQSQLSSKYVDPGTLEKAVVSLQGRGLSSFVPIRNVRILGRMVTKRYMLVHYEIPDGGCPKTFDNPYVLSSEEAIAERWLQDRDVRLAESPISERRTLILAKQSVAGTRYPLNLLVDLDNTRPGELRVTVHSKQLNNAGATLNGYWDSFFMQSAGIVLKEKTTGRTIRHPISLGLLGDAGFTTPWRARPLTLSPGNYQVRLIADWVGAVRPLPRGVDAGGRAGKSGMNILLREAFSIR